MPAYPQSPSQTVGPFFHYGLISLTSHVLINEKTKGKRITLTGTVYDGDGAPIPDALIEIWQADSSGIYHHSADPHYKDADPNFKGFGRSDTVKNGQYRFETIKPAVAKMDDESQSPFIRARVFARGMLIHASTRIYFSDEDNSRDSIFKTVPEARQPSLVAKLEPNSVYRFDIYMQGEDETVFFDI